MVDATTTPDVNGAPPRSGSSANAKRSSQRNGAGPTAGFTFPKRAAAGIPRPMPLRTRADSAGSTRGAFGPLPRNSFTTSSSPTKPRDFHPSTSPTKSSSTQPTSTSKTVSPEHKENRRKKKRTPKKAASPEKRMGAEMDLSGIASLAMQFNEGGIGVGSGTPPRHPTQTPPPPTEPAQRHSSVFSEDNDLYFRSLDQNNHKSGSKIGNDRPLPFFENIKRMGKPNREDSLRYSDAHMESLLAGMRMSSGAALDGSSNSGLHYSGDLRQSPSPPHGSLPAPFPPSFSPGLPGPPTTTRVVRNVSLFGTNLLDDIEAGAAAQPQEQQPPPPPLGGGSYGSLNQHHPYPSPPSYPTPQQQEIARFSSMVQGNYPEAPVAAARVSPETPPQPLASPATEIRIQPKKPDELDGREYSWDSSFEKSHDDEDESRTAQDTAATVGDAATLLARIQKALDPTPWFAPLVVYEEDGTARYDEPPGWFSKMLRMLLFTPEVPEFTSLQQFCWAILLGIGMGIYTAIWKNLIEWCVEFVWKTIPELLLGVGIFTDMSGNFPLPHYVWICPSVFGGILSYIFCVLPKPIPGQNEWIKAVHSRGVQDHETFWTLFFLSTAGMASGLSLGPELPLVLTAGMIGSYLGVMTRQSILSARAMNLTAASAAVAGFFGFPMAGALFVLEIPHRMGLQYFEALSPATIASIVAVLVNRMILRNDVTGYYNYPFLTTTLPSHVFYIAIVYGLVGALVGILYCDAVLKLKKYVHDWFHKSNDDDEHAEESKNNEKEEEEEAMSKLAALDIMGVSTDDDDDDDDESKPLMHRMESSATEKVANKFKQSLLRNSNHHKQQPKWWRPSFGIAHEPYRAAVAGTLAGFLTGVTCMFVPHVLFWGEAQLQTLIDKGRTPLPVFGGDSEPTRDLLAYGYCLVDSKDPAAIEAGFSIGCAALISAAKILVVGLSLGTGIIGGHFWGPLFVGCVASHLFTDVMTKVTGWTGILGNLSAYPCVAILCIMGGSHVVTFRAHMAIMLILTLTISAFYPDRDDTGAPTAGDYSAVFPLLVVSCFVSLMVTRDTVFYKEQRSRGDIMAAPEVLCEPGKEGTPMVVDYVDDESEFYGSDEGSSYYSSSSDEEDEVPAHEDESESLSSSPDRNARDAHLTQVDIEEAFERAQQQNRGAAVNPSYSPHLNRSPPSSDDALVKSDSDRRLQGRRSSSPHFDGTGGGSDKLSELLAKPIAKRKPQNSKRHRRAQSTNDIDPTRPPPSFQSSTPGHSRSGSVSSAGRRSRSDSVSSRKSEVPLVRVSSFGELKEFHPSLFDSARQRASSVNRPPSLPKSGRHSRQSSQASASGYSSDVLGYSSASGALSHDDVERSFGTAAGRDGHARVYGMP